MLTRGSASDRGFVHLTDNEAPRGASKQHKISSATSRRSAFSRPTSGCARSACPCGSSASRRRSSRPGRRADIGAFFGGFRRQSAFHALWESAFRVGVSLGLILWFRDRFNSVGRTARFSAENSFAVYVFHPPIIAAAAPAIHPLAIHPSLKMCATAIVIIPVCFLIAAAARRIPIVERWFS